MFAVLFDTRNNGFVSQSFDTDPTTRHTVWTMIVGGYFTWISVYGINQTQVQRYLTVKEKRQAVKYALIAENVSKLVLYIIFILFTKHNTLRNILNFLPFRLWRSDQICQSSSS